MNKERVAPLARASPELRWEANFGCHSDFSGSHDVTRRQNGVGLAHGVCFLEEDLDALPSDLLRGTLHPEPSPTTIQKPSTMILTNREKTTKKSEKPILRQ